ncbi:MAG: CRISPR-associated endonuclease Cas2 [Patescibacteria group bacterium]
MSDNKPNNKNKGLGFIGYFLEAIFDFSKNFPQAFIRESWHYKDLRIGGYNTENIYRNVNNLRYRGILNRSGRGRFKFTKKGIQWVQGSIQKYFQLRNRNWDKKWRVVIFDIPQELHNSRTKFRKKLKSLGFFMLQKSVFIFPYQCEEELGDICKDFGVSDYIDILITEKAGFRDKELREYYNL